MSVGVQRVQPVRTSRRHNRVQCTSCSTESSNGNQAEITIEIAAATDTAINRSGYGIIVKDRLGKMLQIWAERREGYNEQSTLEAEVVRAAMTLALTIGWGQRGVQVVKQNAGE
ncbi:hypothetical protein ACH5RR_021045 [Cinchona calisaya]|uniref:RNase H type-1 domain-containing protein n=1 Tax=Cinchona calisaya TaxID=153742 RepID=A0ABD2ZHY8_9GENT